MQIILLEVNGCLTSLKCETVHLITILRRCTQMNCVSACHTCAPRNSLNPSSICTSKSNDSKWTIANGQNVEHLIEIDFQLEMQNENTSSTYKWTTPWSEFVEHVCGASWPSFKQQCSAAIDRMCMHNLGIVKRFEIRTIFSQTDEQSFHEHLIRI